MSSLRHDGRRFGVSANVLDEEYKIERLPHCRIGQHLVCCNCNQPGRLDCRERALTMCDLYKLVLRTFVLIFIWMVPI